MKISVNLTRENAEKMRAFIKETGQTKTEFVNRAISDIAIIGISESKEIAKGFIELRNYLSQKEDSEKVREEVEIVCRYCVSLTEKIDNFRK